MAGPGKDESSNVKKASKSKPGPSLDVTSVEFNPLEALYSPECIIPHPQVRVFKNVYEYERLTSSDENATDPESVQDELKRKQPGTTKTKTGGPSQFRKEGAAPKGMKESTQTESDNSKKEFKKPFVLRNILTRMEKEELAGPLSLLQQCLMKKHNVRVWTRSAVNIRGVCRGYIVAFDKHYNLAMIDVDEVYKNPRYTKIQRLRAKKKALEEAEREKLADATSTLSIKGSVHSRLGPRVETGSANSPCRDPRSIKPSSASVENPSRDPRSVHRQSSMSKDSPSRDPRSFQRKSIVSSPSTPSSRDQSWSSAQQSRSDSQGRSRHPSGTRNPVLICESVFLGIHPEELLYRHVNQLFIRGDNVVSVNIISS
ncbi:hypothetical protein LOTGIDRAFT_170438 [Lottia gigantea]|uniref:LSM domain-containing protein n=1 Tax=Lottia gigantea TaxID=225164 RepID=V3YVL8_LOTGI|nr:hypothetical protein LOTGIDRAFT_170438 [Lottia gigantea]ESO82028.1 hypothetical protein LOTGIDRAFT_170438 [Lottia gigantea]